MSWKPTRDSLWLVLAALVVGGGTTRLTAQTDPVRDPVRAFVGGFNPADEDFFAHDTAHTFLVRMRFDADLDGREDVALSETSVFGVGGGPWLLFRQQPAGGYRYLGQFFAGPAGVAVARDPAGRVRLTAGAAVSAAVTHVVRFRVTARRLIKVSETDSTDTGGTSAPPRGPAVEWCALSAYQQAPISCWRPGWPPD